MLITRQSQARQDARSGGVLPWVIIAVVVAGGAAAYLALRHGAPGRHLPVPSRPGGQTGAKQAIEQFISAQNQRSPSLMAPVIPERFLTFSPTGTVVATDTRAQMLAGLAKGSADQSMSLSLGKLVMCGSKSTQQKWVVPTPMGDETCRVKMISGEARALVKLQVKVRVSPTQWQTDTGQFIFYLKRPAGAWLVYASQPG